MVFIWRQIKKSNHDMSGNDFYMLVGYSSEIGGDVFK